LGDDPGVILERARREQRRASTDRNRQKENPMRYWMYAAAALAAVGFAAPEARADGTPFFEKPCKGPFCNHKPGPYGAMPFGGTVWGNNGQTLPVYQAAPWYLYWPYDAHFMTPAPIGGAFYAPPIPGNFPVQPYFPAPAFVPPAPAPAYIPPAGGQPIFPTKALGQ
jgi:hypothetical protein